MNNDVENMVKNEYDKKISGIPPQRKSKFRGNNICTSSSMKPNCVAFLGKLRYIQTSTKTYNIPYCDSISLVAKHCNLHKGE